MQISSGNQIRLLPFTSPLYAGVSLNSVAIAEVVLFSLVSFKSPLTWLDSLIVLIPGAACALFQYTFGASELARLSPTLSGNLNLATRHRHLRAADGLGTLYRAPVDGNPAIDPATICSNIIDSDHKMRIQDDSDLLNWSGCFSYFNWCRWFGWSAYPLHPGVQFDPAGAAPATISRPPSLEWD